MIFGIAQIIEVPASADFELHDICAGPDDPNGEALDQQQTVELRGRSRRWSHRFAPSTLLALLTFVAAGTASGQRAALELSSGSATPAATISLDILLNSRPGSEPAAVQWTLNYSAEDFTAIDFRQGSAATAAGKSLSCAGGVGSLICLVTGINRSTIAAGAVATVALTLSSTVKSPCSLVQLTNVVAASLGGDSIPTVATNGIVATSSAPCLSPSRGVVNAASFIGGSVAPGEIISIFGANMGTPSAASATFNSSGIADRLLAGTRVLFDGAPAPLLFVEPTHINAVVPYGVAGREKTEVQVEYSGKVSQVVPVPVTESMPGIFTIDGSQAAALNEDGSFNSASNPAVKGSIVTLYATGEGKTDPPGVDGKLG